MKIKDLKIIQLIEMCKKAKSCYNCPLMALPCGYEWESVSKEELEKEIEYECSTND